MFGEWNWEYLVMGMIMLSWQFYEQMLKIITNRCVYDTIPGESEQTSIGHR